MPERAASMLNPEVVEDVEDVEKRGGSTRVKGLPVLRLFKMPILFLVGLRPAGALNGVERAVSSLGFAGERALSIGLLAAAEVVLMDEKSLGEGGARVRK